jgi:hypothetical protein
MAEPMGSSDEAALWRRWRQAADKAAGAGPDEMTLAAYTEDRLAPDMIEAVEEWLADNPDAVADVLAARRAVATPAPLASDAVLARATALVGPGAAQILSLRRSSSMSSWRRTAAWGAMAASIVVASFAGFATANSTYIALTGGSSLTVGQELLDPPTGLFNGTDEDPNI